MFIVKINNLDGRFLKLIKSIIDFYDIVETDQLTWFNGEYCDADVYGAVTEKDAILNVCDFDFLSITELGQRLRRCGYHVTIELQF